MDNPYLDTFIALPLTEKKRQRSLLRRKYAHSIPSPIELYAIKGFVGATKDIVEVFAGRGYWAKMLRQIGIHVDSFDTLPPEKLFWEVQQADCTAAACYPHRALMMIWPTAKSDEVGDISLRALNSYAGNKLIFIGDDDACGSKQFWDQVHCKWKLEAHAPLSQRFPEFDDTIEFYIRKDQT